MGKACSSSVRRRRLPIASAMTVWSCYQCSVRLLCTRPEYTPLSSREGVAPCGWLEPRRGMLLVPYPSAVIATPDGDKTFLFPWRLGS